jgi:hypothetical protein
MKTKQTTVCGLLVVLFALALTACDSGGGGGGGGGGGSTHTHTYATAWSFNATQHWHECSCGDKTAVANHNWNTETGLCTINCGALYYNLGDTGPGGGKIFYVSATGFTVQMVNPAQNYTARYLEAAPANMATQLAWASASYATTNIAGTATGIGTGRKNTAVILATDANAPAAKACDDYSNGGKTDWFLLSLDEMWQLYYNQTSVGNIGTGGYWSSSQNDNNTALNGELSGGPQPSGSKNLTFWVRAVRAF